MKGTSEERAIFFHLLLPSTVERPFHTLRQPGAQTPFRETFPQPWGLCIYRVLLLRLLEWKSGLDIVIRR